MDKLGTGFFQSVDGAPALGYRAPRGGEGDVRDGDDVLVVTGEYAAPILRELFDAQGFADVRILAVENRFFGGNIKVAGLLTGQDLIDALVDASRRDRGPGTRRLSLRGSVPRRTRPRRSRPSRSPSCPPPARTCASRLTSVRTKTGARVKPQVVIVGRPNVGKSSLVNRLAGKRVTVVEEHRGVTRDRKAVEVEWGGLNFDVVDTGGWLEAGDSLEAKVSEQAEAALASADLVLIGRGRHDRVWSTRTRTPRGGRCAVAARCCWSSTRSTTPSTRPAAGSSSVSAPATLIP